MNITMIINLIIGVLGAGIGSGIMVIVQMKMKRKWELDDRTAGQMNAQTEALKVLMVDRVKHLAKDYIKQGWVSLDDKDVLMEMYQSFKQLGGNGTLTMTMKEIDKLEVG